MALNQIGFSLPQVCCSCLGEAGLLHEVSAFYGEGGKSIEAKFQVPMCQRCRSKMRTRERIAYAIMFVLLGISGLFISPYAPVSSAVRGFVTGPAAVVFGLALLGFFLIAIGRPFEPAHYVKGLVRFRNPNYQRLFEDTNKQSTT